MSENEGLDAEDFDIVFEVYAEQPVYAFILAQHLDSVKEALQRGPLGALEAIAAIDLAIERLYQHTDFKEAAYKLYLLAVKGNLSIQQDPRELLREIEEQSE